MENGRNLNRLDEIIERAGELPVENQELILAVVQGMLFTRKLLTKPKGRGESHKDREHEVK